MEINVEEQEIENNQHMPSALLKSFFFIQTEVEEIESSHLVYNSSPY